MGSAASAAVLEAPGSELRLPESKLRFNEAQLTALNAHVDALCAQDQKNRMSIELENTVESLVQRIVDGAGQRDPRFKCCHLIALHRGKRMRSRSLEYLITLDSIPDFNSDDMDCSIMEGPPGFAKLKLTGRYADQWEEFMTSSGYLCRDRVLERWVELIARSASARGGGGSRVLSARAAEHATPYNYCYLEKASSPMHTDHRLAIVEGAAWVMVRIGAGRAEAKLMLGARVSGCSKHGYSNRVPVTHPMALLHYTAAQTKFYAVAVGPPTSVACVERASTWQLWHPALEATLDAHFVANSVIGRVAAALNALLDLLRDGVMQGCIRVVSRYSVNCALRRRLFSGGMLSRGTARYWESKHASHYLLLVLDSVISMCEKRSSCGFVYESDRAAVSRRGLRAGDGDWRADATCIKNYITQLHADTLRTDLISQTPSQALETVLFKRWDDIMREATTNSIPPKYTTRQFNYIWRLSSELVKNKKRTICDTHSAFHTNLLQMTSTHLERTEDVIHILAIMLDQARDLYLITNYIPSQNPNDKEHSEYRSKKWNKLKDYYDASSACLLDALRRDPQVRKESLTEDINVIKLVIAWLYKGVKDDKRYLAPVLKPFLGALYSSSLENSWFVEEFDSKLCLVEFEGLQEYCLNVHSKGLEPCTGLLEASKTLAWAKAMVDFVGRSRNIETRLVFPTGDGMAISFPVKFPYQRNDGARVLTLSRRDKADAKLRLAKRAVLGAFKSALIGDIGVRNLPRHSSTDEILASVKSGHYWRNNTRPDIIPKPHDLGPNSLDLGPKAHRKSRRSRPKSAYGFPEITINSEVDSKTLRKKYYTLRNLVYKEPVEVIKDLKRSKSAGASMRRKEPVTRPNMMETLDFINGVKDALCVEESCASEVEEVTWCAEDDWLLGQSAPLNVLDRMRAGRHTHYALGDLVLAMLNKGKFTILQELCSWLGDSSEGVLFALHRLARVARSRSSDRSGSSWKLPEAPRSVAESPQRYKSRSPDYVSGDEAPQPPPLPRLARKTIIPKPYIDYTPPRRLEQLENELNKLEIMSRNNITCLKDDYTGVINPMYDKKIPKDMFTKRSKSLGRSFSARKIGLEVTRYNITLGRKHGRKTNDVVTALASISGETGLEPKNFFQRYNTDGVVGDSYKVSHVIID